MLSVINNLFIFVPDPYTKKNKIRINPKLTDESLQNNIVKSRKIIVELYVKCETDYVNGLKIYEAIGEKKILETTQKQINTLQKESDKIISETNNYIKKPSLKQEPILQQNPIIQKPILQEPLLNKPIPQNIENPIPQNIENPIPQNIENPIIQEPLVQEPLVQKPIIQQNPI